mmetsp:Transcript_17816/g.40465  ORF Transcript_17816/g.40465 Transcript_17816/m.40465 type:complete len:415 (+) Transcript_17816:38-1282(+)
MIMLMYTKIATEIRSVRVTSPSNRSYRRDPALAVRSFPSAPPNSSCGTTSYEKSPQRIGSGEVPLKPVGPGGASHHVQQPHFLLRPSYVRAQLRAGVGRQVLCPQKPPEDVHVGVQKDVARGRCAAPYLGRGGEGDQPHRVQIPARLERGGVGIQRAQAPHVGVSRDELHGHVVAADRADAAQEEVDEGVPEVHVRQDEDGVEAALRAVERAAEPRRFDGALDRLHDGVLAVVSHVVEEPEGQHARVGPSPLQKTEPGAEGLRRRFRKHVGGEVRSVPKVHEAPLLRDVLHGGVPIKLVVADVDRVPGHPPQQRRQNARGIRAQSRSVHEVAVHHEEELFLLGVGGGAEAGVEGEDVAVVRVASGFVGAVPGDPGVHVGDDEDVQGAQLTIAHAPSPPSALVRGWRRKNNKDFT